MKRTLLAVAVAAVSIVLAAGITHAAAPILDFEDLYPGYESYGHIPNGYYGFNWSDAGWITKYYHPGSGYDNTIEGRVGMFTYLGRDVAISDGYFDFTLAKVGAAWNDGQYVDFEGWRDGVKVYSKHQSASFYGEWATFNFLGIDTLKIIPDRNTGVLHPGMPLSGHWIVVDEINTPELPPCALLSLSMLPWGIAYLRGRRRKES